MLVAERHQKIISILEKEFSVRVSELSTLFNVTEETIRRDLEKLEKERKLIRSHGGAVKLENLNKVSDVPLEEREIQNVNEKKKIARKALSYINENDNIVLDASSTALYLARIIPNMKLTIITNSIKVVKELSGRGKIKIISTGGILSKRSHSFIGNVTENTLSLYHVDKAFVSSKGADPGFGLSELNDDQARIKKKMCEIADKVYIMVDYTKLGKKSFSHIAKTKEGHTIITNSGVDQKVI
jgi:DeoR/GlpR family transcriptional regulator of sugar metabolism